MQPIPPSCSSIGDQSEKCERTEHSEEALWANTGRSPSFEPQPRGFKDIGRTTMVLSEPLLAALRRLDSAYRAGKNGRIVRC